MEQHRLVVLGSRDENIELITRAKSKGYYTIVCDGYDKSFVKNIADKTYDIDVMDVDAIAMMCKNENVDGIIGSFSDLIFEQITKIADVAGLKWYITPNLLGYYRDKYLQKKLLNELGIETPLFTIGKKQDISKKYEEIEFPVVVKPLHGWGSRGISVLNTVDELMEYLSKLTIDEDCEIEEYCDAYEYNSISWVVNGKVNVLGISDRERNPFTGVKIPTLNRIVYPSIKYQELKIKVQDLLQKFVKKTGQQDGPLSMQFFYKEGNIIVVEIAGRVLGHEHDLIHLCGGSDVNELLLDYVYGDTEKVENDIIEMKEGKYSCGIYFLCEDGTYMDDISSINKLFEAYNVVASEIFVNEKTIYNNKYPYLAKCYFESDSRAKLDELTEELYNKIYVDDGCGNNAVVPFYLEVGR